MIQGWYCGEKLDAYHSQAIKGQWLFLFSKYVGDSDWRFHSPSGSHHLSQAFDSDEDFLLIFKTSVILAFLDCWSYEANIFKRWLKYPTRVRSLDCHFWWFRRLMKSNKSVFYTFLGKSQVLSLNLFSVDSETNSGLQLHRILLKGVFDSEKKLDWI